MQEYRSGHNEAVLKTVWGKPHGGSNPSSCAKNMGMTVVIPIFFLFMGIERDSRDELPFKKSINNAFQGRDEQTHKVSVCGDRAQRKPQFAREKPFCGSKTLCLTVVGLR